MSERPFFVGYLGVPAGLRAWLLAIAAGLVAGFGLAAWIIGVTQADPGTGAFRFDLGRQDVTGVITMEPYPILHVSEGTEAVPAGRSILLSGGGKRGVQGRVGEGGLFLASGQLLQRGDLDMIQVRGGQNGLAAQEGEGPEVAEEDLGRWRLAGEMCDGKCLAGAMRPGRGIGHRACANLCVVGGVPPVFVSTRAVEGSEFLLLGGPDGGPLEGDLYDYMALYIEVEGQLLRRGEMLVFLIDPDTIEVL